MEFMRKFVKIVLLCMALVAPTALVARNEDGSYTGKELKEFKKRAEKESKNLAKKYKKAGWDVNGTASLETAIFNHLMKTADYGGPGKELLGNAQDIKSVSLGGKVARTDAATKYAESCGQSLEGRINAMDNVLDEDQRQQFIHGIESTLAQDLNGEMVLSFELYRKNKNGKYDVNVYYIVDEAAARKAQIRAIKAQAELTKVTRAVADEISQYVKDGAAEKKTEKNVMPD